MVLFFYFKRDEPSQNSFVAAVRSLLYQALSCDLVDGEMLMTYLFQEAFGPHRIALSRGSKARDLLAIALQAVQYKSGNIERPIYIVLDGLDECEPQEERGVLSKVQDVLKDVRNGGYNIRCLFVGQHDGPSDTELRNVPAIHLDTSSIGEDIDAYVSYYLTKKSAELLEREDLMNDILEDQGSDDSECDTTAFANRADRRECARRIITKAEGTPDSIVKSSEEFT